MLTALAASGCSGDVAIAPPTSTGNGAAARSVAAQHALDALIQGVRNGDVASASPTVRAAVDNARRLGVRGLALQYVDANLGALTPADQRRFGARAWAASVQVRYRLPFDTGATQMTTGFVFAPRSGRASVVSIGGYGERSPLWMRGAAAIRRTARVVVVAAGPAAPAATYLALGRRALSDVHAVLPDWHGTLVLDVPRTEAELESVLDADPGTYADIAAVTTTVDGSLQRGSPVHVFVNRTVFDDLKRRGAQVVISHEATHVATRGPFSDMPTWLLEGFADYVALDHADVPVQVAAAQVLARIRRHGLPTHLPSAADLQPSATGLGATYEEAWLACRYLAGQYGETTLVRFYDTVRAGTPLDEAFSRVVGVSQREFMRGWRTQLARLAG
ncbi:MAG: hypothetical protein ACTHJH_09930 [Marmoricola sp.]